MVAVSPQQEQISRESVQEHFPELSLGLPSTQHMNDKRPIPNIVRKFQNTCLNEKSSMTPERKYKYTPYAKEYKSAYH